MSSGPVSSRTATLEAALRGALVAGLPLVDSTAGDVLPNQRCVYANAQHPHERASRITATNRLLRDLLKGLGTSPRAAAARRLFGVGQGLRGTTLSLRREEAAQVMERHVDHFRKHIEPKFIDELAFAIHEQNLRYTPASSHSRPHLGAHEDTPVLTLDSFTEQEELLCQVWSAVYGYRAELIAVQRRIEEAREEDRRPDSDLQDHVDAGTWQLARLLTFVAEYLDRYGDTILQGEVPFSIEGLVRLAGWQGELTSAKVDRLRYGLARVGPNNLDDFIDALRRPHHCGTERLLDS